MSRITSVIAVFFAKQRYFKLKKLESRKLELSCSAKISDGSELSFYFQITCLQGCTAIAMSKFNAKILS